MDTIVILGAGQSGRAASRLLNYDHLRLLAFGDNAERLWGTRMNGTVVCSVEDAIKLEPDLILIGVTDQDRTGQLKRQAIQAGFDKVFLFLRDLYRYLDIRSATLFYMADRLLKRKVPGDLAELGVYKGDTAWKLNLLFPDRTLYLFDTFAGFDPRDIAEEERSGYSRAQTGDFADTSLEAVLARLPYPKQARVRKGFFPETAKGLETARFCLVSLDADLYAPLLAGLEYFYPRLSPGGMICLHDYGNPRFSGARQAVEDYEALHGPLCLVPLCDLHGSAVITAP